jgi:hypothetical protein
MGFADIFKKYVVYYDGPSVETNVCGTGGGNLLTAAPEVYPEDIQALYTDVPTDAITAHELLHALGALPAGAPNACTAATNPLGAVADSGHPCDSPQDILYPVASGAPLAQLILDVNHDDYYAHSGTWDDIQDSAWLHLFAAPVMTRDIEARRRIAPRAGARLLVVHDPVDGGTQTALTEAPAARSFIVGAVRAPAGTPVPSLSAARSPCRRLRPFVPVSLTNREDDHVRAALPQTFAGGARLALRRTGEGLEVRIMDRRLRRCTPRRAVRRRTSTCRAIFRRR